MKKNNAISIDYSELKKGAARFKGEYVTYTGKIMHIRETDKNSYMIIATSIDQYGWADHLIEVKYEGYSPYYEEDVVTIYGTIIGDGVITRANVEMYVPAIEADIME